MLFNGVLSAVAQAVEQTGILNSVLTSHFLFLFCVLTSTAIFQTGPRSCVRSVEPETWISRNL